MESLQQEAPAYFSEKKPRLKKEVTSLKSLTKLGKEGKGSTILASPLTMGHFLGRLGERLWTTKSSGIP